MYLKFYGLLEPPFNMTPDPRFLYFSDHHREAYHHLLYGIESRKGFIELTGEVGSGKTTLCRALLNELRSRQVATALILNPWLTAVQLLRAIVTDFGLSVGRANRLECVDRLNRFLLEKNAEGYNVALMIDEAQDLSPQVMEQVRLLSNLESDRQKLMQIVLCGQPELKERLERPDLRQLRQRITVRYHLRSLTEGEMAVYIEHRLRIAGADSRIVFDPKALRLIYRYARGIPRLINAVCDNALLAGYVAGTADIGPACIRKAIEQLEGGG